MANTVRIGIVGDFNAANHTHVATNEALEHAAICLRVDMNSEWLPTDGPSLLADIQGFDALLISPGSPYLSMEGTLDAIHYARENHVPTLGTCGGCQHMIIEYARNVLGFNEAEHAESTPGASTLFITPLTCSLVGQTLPIRLLPTSLASAFYGGSTEVAEKFYCRFGLNPEYKERLDRSGFRIVGTDDEGETRLLELPDEKFYIATLFVPQTSSTSETPHPLVMAFVKAAQEAI